MVEVLQKLLQEVSIKLYCISKQNKNYNNAKRGEFSEISNE